MTWKLKKKRRRTMISLVILVSLTRVIEGNKDLQIGLITLQPALLRVTIEAFEVTSGLQ